MYTGLIIAGAALIVLTVVGVMAATSSPCDKQFDPDEFCACPDCCRGKRP